MIALSIAITWLTLTAAGFQALSVIGRIEARTDVEADRASGDRDSFVSADVLGDLRSAAVPAALLR
jgi:hypothetical protein